MQKELTVVRGHVVYQNSRMSYGYLLIIGSHRRNGNIVKYGKVVKCKDIMTCCYDAKPIKYGEKLLILQRERVRIKIRGYFYLINVIRGSTITETAKTVKTSVATASTVLQA